MSNHNYSIKLEVNLRFICLLILIVITLIEIGPIPITGLVLIYVILFRPLWFYNLVIKIYDK